jgi:hypothetical protein
MADPNLNRFCFEDVTFITDEVMLSMVKSKNMDHCIRDMVQLVYFNKDRPDNMVVRFNDDGGELHGQNGWEQMDKEQIVKALCTRVLHFLVAFFVDVGNMKMTEEEQVWFVRHA